MTKNKEDQVVGCTRKIEIHSCVFKIYCNIFPFLSHKVLITNNEKGVIHFKTVFSGLLDKNCLYI